MWALSIGICVLLAEGCRGRRLAGIAWKDHTCNLQGKCYIFILKRTLWNTNQGQTGEISLNAWMPQEQLNGLFACKRIKTAQFSCTKMQIFELFGQKPQSVFPPCLLKKMLLVLRCSHAASVTYGHAPQSHPDTVYERSMNGFRIRQTGYIKICLLFKMLVENR